MKLYKRILALFVTLVTSFSLCCSSVLAAWQNDLGYWYINCNLAQFVVSSGLTVGGTVAGAYFGNPIVGELIGGLAAVGIQDLAEYYAAGYTDDDCYAAEQDYLSTLDYTTVTNQGLFEYYPTGFHFDDEAKEYLSSTALSSSPGEFVIDGYALQSAYYPDTFGWVVSEEFTLPSGLYNLSVDSASGIISRVYTAGSYGRGMCLYGLNSDGDWVLVNEVDSKSFPAVSTFSTVNSPYTKYRLQGRLVTEYGGISVGKSLTCQRNFHIECLSLQDDVTSIPDSSTRFSSLTQVISSYNIDNSYTDNPTAVNYYIGVINDDGSAETYDPSLYNEETLIFTEPTTGTQYQTTGWEYYYDSRSYLLTLEPGTMTANDTDVAYVAIEYGDDDVQIQYLDSGTIVLATDTYDYLMVSQSACALDGHSYTYETIKESTCTSPGERKYTCTICGDQYAEAVPMNSHAYSYSVLKEPTCINKGVYVYTCATCGNQVTESVDALGHAWEPTEVVDPEYDSNGNITEMGYTKYSCSRCGETKVETDATEESQEIWFTKLISKFSWLSAVGQIYRQLIADITSDAATAAAIADGTVMLADVTGDHAAMDGETVTYTAPELALSFGASDKYGVDWENIKPLDLSWYAPYKETVDGIVSGILWLSYLFLLIKRAPGIIRGSEMVTEDSIKIDAWNLRHRR